ncbi:hypothetical protein GCM10027074_28830 [Streptomyces deserti]
MDWKAGISLAATLALAAGATTGCGRDSVASPPQPAQTTATTPPDLANELEDEQVPIAPQGAAVPESSPGTNEKTVHSYLTDVVQNADKVWTDFFRQIGLDEPLVSYAIVTPDQTPIRSKCTMQTEQGPVPLVVSHDTPMAYYCPADELSPGHTGTIYLPVTTMQKMWTGNIFERQSKRTGDFAAAILTAHEFGHHVTDELQIQYQKKGMPFPPPAGKWNELIADCMAGAWAATAYHSGYLEPNDFEEAATALEALGDNPQTHGTPAERREALTVGFAGVQGRYGPGSPAACIETYWKDDRP